jgi:hypothetical protein
VQRFNSPLPMENEWLGRLCCWKHHIVFRLRSTPEGPWYFALKAWAQTSVLVWPAIRHRYVGYANSFYFEPSTDIEAPMFKSVWDLDEWVACTYRMRSPRWQMANCPKSCSVVGCACRRTVTDLPVSLLKVASDNGFWLLERTFLVKLARHLDLDCGRAPTLIQVLLVLVMHCSHVAVTRAYEIISHRLANSEASMQFCAELAELDEVDECLDRFDRDTFGQQRDKAAAKLGEHGDFRSEYFKRMQAIHTEQQTTAKPKLGAKKKKTLVDSRWHRTDARRKRHDAEGGSRVHPTGNVHLARQSRWRVGDTLSPF